MPDWLHGFSKVAAKVIEFICLTSVTQTQPGGGCVCTRAMLVSRMLPCLHCCLQPGCKCPVLYKTVDIKKMDVTSAVLLILTAVFMLMASIIKAFGPKQL